MARTKIQDKNLIKRSVPRLRQRQHRRARPPLPPKAAADGVVAAAAATAAAATAPLLQLPLLQLLLLSRRRLLPQAACRPSTCRNEAVVEEELDGRLKERRMRPNTQKEPAHRQKCSSEHKRVAVGGGMQVRRHRKKEAGRQEFRGRSPSCVVQRHGGES